LKARNSSGGRKGTIWGWRGYGVTCSVVLKIQGHLEASVSSRGWGGTLRGLKMLWWKLVELSKIPPVVGGKIFKRAEDISRQDLVS
jgi:hypothetical protein